MTSTPQKPDKAIIFHGTMGAPDGNWFGWLKSELAIYGIETFIPRLPTPESQTVANWLIAVKNQAPDPDENTLLIGHSCGANFLLHYLPTLLRPPFYVALAGIVIDKIGDREIDGLNSDFISRAYDWDGIKRNIGHSTLVHGDDDPYVPLDQPVKVSRELDIPLVLIPTGKHLNTPAGYTKFPYLLDQIENRLRTN